MDPRLKVIIEVVDRATKSINAISRTTLTQLRRLQFALLGVAATVSGFITLAIKGSEGLRMAMARLELHAGRMGPAFAAAVEAISTQLGRALGFSKKEIAELLSLLSQTFGPEAATRIAGAVMILARALGISLADAANLFQRALEGDIDALRILASLGLDITKFTSPLAAATEITSKLAEKAKSATGATQQLGAAFADFLGVIGGGKDSPFNALVLGLTTFIRAVTDYLSAHPGLVNALQVLAIGIAAVSLALGVLISWFVAVNLLGPAFGAAIALLAGPFGLLGIAIVALVALLIYWALNWEKIWTDIKTVAFLIWDEIQWRWLLFTSHQSQQWFEFTGFLERTWQSAWEAMRAVANGIWDAIQSIFNKAVGAMEQLRNIWREAQAILSAITGAVSSAQGAMRRITGGLPGFQHGGVMAQGGLAMVGEAGPEIVALPGGSRVIPNHALGSVDGGDFIVNGNIYGIENLRQLVIQWVRDTRRGGGFQDFG